MAYEVIMPYHLHMPSYFLETFTEYPYIREVMAVIFLIFFYTNCCRCSYNCGHLNLKHKKKLCQYF